MGQTLRESVHKVSGKESLCLLVFDISLIGYEFKGGCSPNNAEGSEPCSLWGGAYILRTTSMPDINTISDLLSKRYGEHKRTDEVQDKRSTRKNILLSKINIRKYIWEQADKSAVELFFKSYDRDYVDELKQGKKGVFRVGVRYYSPGNTKENDATEIKMKSF